MEPVPDVYLKRPRLTPDVANSVIRLEQPITNNASGLRLRATLSDENGDVLTAECSAEYDLSPRLDLAIPDDRFCLWSIDDPHLYDVEIALIDGDDNVVDSAKSYAGLRSVSIAGKAIKINNKVVFQRLVLDQGYYPDGIMTAPSDESLIEDIQLSIDAGFNGARLHQKVFEERFLYHADRMGYIVWGEFGDWGCSHNGPLTGEHQTPGSDYITQWLECLERDYSHPSIVGWCPLNETWQTMTEHITTLDDVTHGMYYATKAMDGTRPVLDTSGYSHRVAGADVYDSHDYDQNPDTFRIRHAGLSEGKPFVNTASDWGLSERIVGNTQLTDIYQEQNGIYKYDRSGKFDLERIRKAQIRPAAIELANNGE